MTDWRSENQEFHLGHVKFEMSKRYSNRNSRSIARVQWRGLDQRDKFES